MIFPLILLVIGLCLMIFSKSEQSYYFGYSPSFGQIIGFILVICSIFCFIAIKIN
jgi:hypothetical protein